MDKRNEHWIFALFSFRQLHSKNSSRIWLGKASQVPQSASWRRSKRSRIQSGALPFSKETILSFSCLRCVGDAKLLRGLAPKALSSCWCAGVFVCCAERTHIAHCTQHKGTRRNSGGGWVEDWNATPGNDQRKDWSSSKITTTKEQTRTVLNKCAVPRVCCTFSLERRPYIDILS